MIYFLLLVSLAAVASCTQNKASSGPHKIILSSFRPSLGFKSEVKPTFIDWSYISNSLNADNRDLASFGFLLDANNDIVRKCSATSFPDHLRILHNAQIELENCMSHVHYGAAVTGGGSEYCRLDAQKNYCWIQFTNKLRHCLPPYKMQDFPYYNIIQAVYNYTCANKWAQDQYAYFLTYGAGCMSYLNPSVTTPCGKYPRLPEMSYIYSDRDCVNISHYWDCVQAKFPQCTPTVINYLKVMGQNIARFYVPCPSLRH